MLSLDIPIWKLFGWLGRPRLWATGEWQLHYDNTPIHESHLVQNFLAKHQITQPLYSPELVPCNFWLFPKLKSPLKGKIFQAVSEILGNMMGQLMMIRNCVRSQGAYFEGDWGVVVLCTMFLVSSSRNVSIFHSARLDTFWTDLYNRPPKTVCQINEYTESSQSKGKKHIMWTLPFESSLITASKQRQ